MKIIEVKAWALLTNRDINGAVMTFSNGYADSEKLALEWIKLSDKNRSTRVTDLTYNIAENLNDIKELSNKCLRSSGLDKLTLEEKIALGLI
jgi:hypothetical protein